MNEDLMSRLKTMPLHQLYMIEKEMQEVIKSKEQDEKNYLTYCEQRWD